MSSNFLLNFKQSYILVPVVVIISVVLLFIDSSITKKKFQTKDYLKIALLSAVITMGIVYIHTIPGQITEEVLTGSAPF